MSKNITIHSNYRRQIGQHDKWLQKKNDHQHQCPINQNTTVVRQSNFPIFSPTSITALTIRNQNLMPKQDNALTTTALTIRNQNNALTTYQEQKISAENNNKNFLEIGATLLLSLIIFIRTVKPIVNEPSHRQMVETIDRIIEQYYALHPNQPAHILGQTPDNLFMLTFIHIPNEFIESLIDFDRFEAMLRRRLDNEVAAQLLFSNRRTG